ncbi:toxin-antitoxin system YwqK family antitoxin [Reichenbachiella sp.]|uniref:toxin-antitoxin system YwqK family antitoxin n=1 Tax=Reichenbachiella sp. TaxID=2184521 RepID=UPI003BB211A1
MYQRFLFIALFFLVACQERQSAEIAMSKVDEHVAKPTIEYDISDLFFDRKTSLWQFKSDSSLVSGVVKEFFSNGTLKRVFGLYQGKKEGLLTVYFSNGQLKFEEHYENNKLHGEVKRWSLTNGYQLRALLNYKNGKLHGGQKKWFVTGELHKLMHMNEGKENGLQQAFRKNGVLYANYEAKNGRVFGLKRSNLCYELDDQQVVYKD